MSTFHGDTEAIADEEEDEVEAGEIVETAAISATGGAGEGSEADIIVEMVATEVDEDAEISAEMKTEVGAEVL